MEPLYTSATTWHIRAAFFVKTILCALCVNCKRSNLIGRTTFQILGQLVHRPFFCVRFRGLGHKTKWRLPCNADSTVPATTPKRELKDCPENEEPVRQKPKLSLFLKKKTNVRFSKPLSSKELKKAVQGVTPVSTQSSNDWAL